MIKTGQFISVGATIVRDGKTFKCVLRPEIDVPRAACSGCDFVKYNIDCNGIDCSRFDRRDKKMVWFKRID